MSDRGRGRGRGGRGAGGSRERSSSSGGPSSRGDFSRPRGGGAGGFRGGGRGRGGAAAPKERSSSRDATSLSAIFQKNTRYDHRVAKEKTFWEKSKKLRSYHRLLKKEGLERDDIKRVKGGAQPQEDGGDDADNDAEMPSTTPADYVPSTALHAADPNAVFAVQEDRFSKAPEGRKKQEKRKRSDVMEEGGDAAASSSAVGASGRPALPSDGPDFKKQRRLTPAELAALREQKKKAWEEKQQKVVEQQVKRKEKHTLLTQKTDRGQPKLNNQMQHLLEKLQKQAEAAKTATPAMKR
jgi:hypothetical protein